jgi:hypothetical protein
MPDIPEPEHEAQPILKPPWKPTITDKPACVPGMVNNTANLPDKIAASKVWVGIKHFVYGFSLAATASIVAGAHPYLAIGLGVAGGVAEATRKVAKETAAEQGKDWADILDKILSILVALIEAWKKRKEVKK